MRGQSQVCGNASFQRERVHGCEHADPGGRGPQCQWLMLERESARRRSDEPPELPGEAGERHVAAQQARLREVDDERSVDRAVETLAQSEDRDREPEDHSGLRARERVPAEEDGQKRSGPRDPHECKPAHPPLPLDELHERELRNRDHT